MNRSIFALVVVATVGAAVSVGATPAASSKTPQCTRGGIGGDPLVPTAQAAREIFRTVAKAINPGLMTKYPDIVVEDAGDHWDVSQTNSRDDEAARHPSPGTVVVTAGGGMLGISIDKCTGAISNAALAR